MRGFGYPSIISFLFRILFIGFGGLLPPGLLGGGWFVVGGGVPPGPGGFGCGLPQPLLRGGGGSGGGGRCGCGGHWAMVHHGADGGDRDLRVLRRVDGLEWFFGGGTWGVPVPAMVTD